MKSLSLLLGFITMNLISVNIFGQFAPEGEELEHTHVFTPQEEIEYFREARQKGNFELLEFRFEQTSWRECTDTITGNFTGFNCANRRGISVILKDFMDTYLPQCVQEGLDALNLGELDQLHIIHDGILGDRRHSPRSMHAENRAIDINAFRVTLYSGEEVTLNFKDVSKRGFFQTFRKCWGKVIHEKNGCPIYASSLERTGSIGWEDKNHQNHMHTSVPYCVGGNYAGNYFRR